MTDSKKPAPVVVDTWYNSGTNTTSQMFNDGTVEQTDDVIPGDARGPVIDLTSVEL